MCHIYETFILFLARILHFLPFIVSQTAVETGSVILFSSLNLLLSAPFLSVSLDKREARVSESLFSMKDTASNLMPVLRCAI